MTDLEILIALVAVAVLLVRLADLIAIPYPIVLVLAGLAISAVPWVPDDGLSPEMIFLLFLPPLLFSAAQATSPRDLKVELAPISGLVVGLSITTMVAVAAVAQLFVPELDWTEALLLGAIVAPTDPVAAIATFSRVGVPERVSRLVEAESMVNDATALVFYRVLVAAVVTGAINLTSAAGELVVGVAGGILIGLAFGLVTVFLQRRLLDSALSILMTVVAAYGSYLAAEHVGASGVLSAVAAGILVGSRSRHTVDAETRLSGIAFWETFVFALNVLLFILLGLRLPSILDAVRNSFTAGELITHGLTVSLVVILVRIAWQYLPSTVGRVFPPALRFDTGETWRERFVVGWSGMRGAVSLAAALSLPLALDSGAPFGDRDLLAFLTISVIFATLVLQGLSLPAIIRWTGLDRRQRVATDEIKARIAIAAAAQRRIDEIVGQRPDLPEDLVDRYRGLYEAREERWRSVLRRDERTTEEVELIRSLPDLRRQLIDAEREELISRRRRGLISIDAYRQLEHELDLDESRIVKPLPRV